MRVDWSMLLTIFLAVVLANLFRDALRGGNDTGGTRVGGKVQSPAVPTITYANPIDKFLSEKYPNAMR